MTTAPPSGEAGNEHWAHAPEAASSQPPHLLNDHLRSVGHLAARLAPPALSELAHLAGLWHDLGKRRAGFQRYIRSGDGTMAHIEGRVAQRVADRDKTHSTAGALWAEQYLQEQLNVRGVLIARMLQYVIAGHHAGLADWTSGTSRGALNHRFGSDEARRESDESLQAPNPADILRPDLSQLPVGDLTALMREPASGQPGRFALWIRMLFSALVDADFLDTEAYFDASRPSARSGATSIDSLKTTLDAHMEKLSSGATGRVNEARALVLAQCREKAALPSGVFRLTVPTGGGKTLASLSFALDHALANGHRRVVYAIPYTSIIEQNADVFRKALAALGDDVVIEHHSNVEAKEDQETPRSRLACENWDASLTVTTNVQLFESLFASRTSRCRKLHNLQHSVIVLDEAQLLPTEFLAPIVDVLRYLVQDFQVTVLLCTATQPVLDRSRSLDPQHGLQRGIGPVTDIIDDVPALYRQLERVRVVLPADLKQPRSWPDLADEIAGHDAVLTIVNRRADAAELFRLVRGLTAGQGGGRCWHLSALMCAMHRSHVIAQIKLALQERREALASGRTAPPIRVVSTQLVEAGVDLDFPVVYRAMAGVDAVAQAAGRCNREGLLPDKGVVYVFVPPTASPPGHLSAARSTSETVWNSHTTDPLGLGTVQRYFERMLVDGGSTDKHSISQLLRLEPDRAARTLPVSFRTAADKFRLIDDQDSATVIVRYRTEDATDNIDALIGRLQHEGPSRWLLRKLQRFGVTVYQQTIDAMLLDGSIEAVAACPGLYVLARGFDYLYDEQTGLTVQQAPGDPALVF